MKNSNIQWTDHTFNPWEGCTKVSPGCAHCYAEARNIRWAKGANWGPGAPRRRTSESNWRQPFKWNKEAAEGPSSGDDPLRRPRVFCASLADWLDDEVPIEWLADLLEVIRLTPNLDWLLLTKRPENWRDRICRALAYVEGIDYSSADGWEGDAETALGIWINDWTATDGTGIPENIWIGTTVEDQKRADLRIRQLTTIPARIRFLSVEPLLEQVDLKLSSHLGPIVNVNPNFSKQDCLVNWVIVGGESGSGARPFFAEWADDLRRQCEAGSVAFFMKQMGSNPQTSNANVLDWPDETEFNEPGEGEDGFAAAKIVLRDRGHGGDIEEFPSELQIRDFPR